MGSNHSSQSKAILVKNKETSLKEITNEITKDTECLLEELKGCSICLDTIDNDEREIIKTDCSHYFHKKCLKEWFSKSLSCPLCRKNLTHFNLHMNTNTNLNKKYEIGKNYSIMHYNFQAEEIGMLIHIYQPNEHGNKCFVFKINGTDKYFFDNIYEFKLI
jgi:hypothetical protein